MLTRRVAEYAKEVARLAPVRPALKAGLRAAIATLVPMLLAGSLHPGAGVWLSIAGFNGAFADRGGSYRSRATAMSAVAVATAIAVFVGGLAGGHPALAVGAVLVWVTASSYAGVYGATAAFVGNVSASAFVISLALPASDLSEAVVRTGLMLLGSLWAMLLSLVLWPIRPYRPARLAVGTSLRAVAEFARDLGRLSDRTSPAVNAEAWHALIGEHHARVRQTLEDARETLAALRRGRQDRGRGERLLVLFQSAEMAFTALIALADVVESLAHEANARVPLQQTGRALGGLSRTLQEVARVVETEGRARELPTLEWTGEVAAPGSLGGMARARTRHAARLLMELRSFAAAAVETAPRLAEDRPVTVAPTVSGIGRAGRRVRPLLEPLRENLSRDSMVLRHALRVGITTALAVWLTHALNQSHGYWVTITVLVIMLPHSGPTFLKALQRVLGTVLGGILAALVASWLRDPMAINVLAFFTVAASVALIAVNYGLYTIFLTLTFVLLAEAGTGDWSLAGVRIVNTALGGALALAGTWLLWERPERELFPQQLATAVRAELTYFRSIVSRWLGDRSGAIPALEEARRELGLATINAEVSFQRLLSEPRSRGGPVEPVMTLLLYIRRFAGSTTALTAISPERLTPQARATSHRLANAVEQVLDDLAEAIARDRSPAPLPELLVPSESAEISADDVVADDPLLQAQLQRIVRQLLVIHGAVSRRAQRQGLEPTAAVEAPGRLGAG